MFKILILISVLLAFLVVAKKQKRPKPGLGSSGRIDGAGLSIFTSEDSINLIDLPEPKPTIINLRGGGRDEEVVTSPFKSEPEGPKPNRTGVVPISGNENEEEDDDDEDDDSRRLNVFLPDTRVETVYNTYPARTVGYWAGGCTATLIDSRGIIVTNAHCMKFNADGSFSSDNWNTYFYAGLKKGNYLGRSTAKAAWYSKSNDYCVMKLWTNIAATVGNMGAQFKSSSFFSTTRYLNMISYSGDHCNTWDTCVSKLSTGRTRGLDSNGIRHDLDAKRGSSGSTMYAMISGWPYHQALNFAEYRDGGDVSLTLASYENSHANLAKPGGVWADGWNKVKDL